MIDTVADSSKKTSSLSSEDHTQIKEIIQHFWTLQIQLKCQDPKDQQNNKTRD